VPLYRGIAQRLVERTSVARSVAPDDLRRDATDPGDPDADARWNRDRAVHDDQAARGGYVHDLGVDRSGVLVANRSTGVDRPTRRLTAANPLLERGIVFL
jgi:hypothetical protein